MCLRKEEKEYILVKNIHIVLFDLDRKKTESGNNLRIMGEMLLLVRKKYTWNFSCIRKHKLKSWYFFQTGDEITSCYLIKLTFFHCVFNVYFYLKETSLYFKI